MLPTLILAGRKHPTNFILYFLLTFAYNFSERALSDIFCLY